MMPPLGQTLKAARQARGMTQLQLAEALYVTRQTVSNWENGRSEPDLETLGRIAELLGVELSLLLGQEPSEPAPIAEEPPPEAVAPEEEVVQPPAPRRCWWLGWVLLGLAIIACAAVLLAQPREPRYTVAWFQQAASVQEQSALNIYIRPNNSSVTLPDERGRTTWPFALLLREEAGVGVQVEQIRVVPLFADGTHQRVDYSRDELASRCQSSHIDRYGLMRLFIELATEKDKELTGVGFHIFITNDKNQQIECRYYASADEL